METELLDMAIRGGALAMMFIITMTLIWINRPMQSDRERRNFSAELHFNGKDKDDDDDDNPPTLPPETRVEDFPDWDIGESEHLPKDVGGSSYSRVNPYKRWDSLDVLGEIEALKNEQEEKQHRN